MATGNDNSTVPFVLDRLGNRRYLANLPGEPKLGTAPFSEQLELIPRSKWAAVDFRFLGASVLNQHQSLACVGHAACTAFTVAWRLRGGSNDDEFSPCFVYGMINHGVDGGSNIGEALDCLRASGICLDSEVPEGMLFQRDFPQQAFATAKRFRVELAISCPTFDEIASAIQLNFPVAFGIDIGDDFNTGEGGILGERVGPRRPDHGHAMCAVGLQLIDGKPYL